MTPKSTILQTVSQALRDGLVTTSDLETIIQQHTSTESAEQKQPPSKLSAVDVMFYIAGIVFFAAIMALVTQSWEGGPATRILLSAGVGLVLWLIAAYLLRLPKPSDIQRGLSNSLLLTGSFSLIAGGFIIARELFTYEDFNFFATAGTLAVLGSIHIAFGGKIKRDIVTLIGALLVVAAFPSLVSGIIQGAMLPGFIYSLIIVVSAALLAYATRILAWTGINSKGTERAFDPLSAFAALMALYVASFDNSYGILWLLALVVGIIGLFYLSIVMQDKFMLGNGSLFLVIAIITISYRYFSDSVAVSLLVSAAGLLGTAIMAANINRRYIK